MTVKRKTSKIPRSKKYRSQFEAFLAQGLEDRLIYEPVKIPYTKMYTPDYLLITRSGKQIYIEAKGYFKPNDRTKMLKVKEEHPELDIRIVFQNANQRLSRNTRSGRSSTYQQWAKRYGFKCAHKEIPNEWLNE